MRKFLTAILFLIAIAIDAAAADIIFKEHFTDSTLRIDFILSGDAHRQQISLDKLTLTPKWVGKRKNINRVPLHGNAQVIMTDSISGDTIYAEAFSHLFLEWLDTDEAQTTSKAMDAVIRVPRPKGDANVNIKLFDHHQITSAELSLHISPDNDNLIRRPRIGKTLPYSYLLKNGNPEEKIDVAIIAEGFKGSDMGRFRKAAQIAMESILSHEPFKSLSSRFNFIAVETPSSDSGVSIPRNNEWKNTVCSSHFGTFYSPRYLTTSELRRIHDMLLGIPYEHLIILANTEEYGGGGIYNCYTLTSAFHPTFRAVVAHEFGHSFAGLADEYFYDNDPLMSGTYPTDTEPWEQNITTLRDFKSKWADMLPEGVPIPGNAVDGDESSIGVYEGGGYTSKGVYRPVDACRMRYNTASGFCPVCRRAIRKIILFTTSE